MKQTLTPRRGLCFTLLLGLRLPPVRVGKCPTLIFFIPPRRGNAAKTTKSKKMKNLLLSAAAFLMVSLAVTAQNVPSYVPANGLVGWWPFNGNANDESGNGNHGTVNGATLTADRFGNAGKAYSFDGADDNIEFPTSDSLGIGSFQGLTISIWFKTNLQGDIRFIHFFNDTYDLSIHNSGQGNEIHCINYHIGVGPNFLHYIQATSNQWNNLTWTMNFGQNQSYVYLNGIKVNELFPSQFLLSSSMKLKVGDNGVWPLTGSIDDIAIYNRALTPQEITQLYNQGICQTSITVTDTLLIHTGITSYNPVAYGNTLKVWPNPGNTAITLDAGNLSSMQGWKIRISNSLGQEVYPATLISQQQQVLSMSTWGGNGLYLLHLINPQGHITEVKKIVLAP